MILGTGVDLVEVPRMARIRARHAERGLRRLFTPREIEYCLSHAGCDASLAARLAAKEAFFKALGTGVYRGGSWLDVEVGRRRSGAPTLRLRRRAAALARRKGIRRVHLALSHAGGVAMAQVVLEG